MQLILNRFRRVVDKECLSFTSGQETKLRPNKQINRKRWRLITIYNLVSVFSFLDVRLEIHIALIDDQVTVAKRESRNGKHFGVLSFVLIEKKG